VSSEKALNQITELLGYDDLNKVPTGPGRDYLTTLVLIARGYDFGGMTFEEAHEKIHNIDWHNTDEETLRLKAILEIGRFERFDN
jgi:hypothetical protein